MKCSCRAPAKWLSLPGPNEPRLMNINSKPLPEINEYIIISLVGGGGGCNFRQIFYTACFSYWRHVIVYTYRIVAVSRGYIF